MFNEEFWLAVGFLLFVALTFVPIKSVLFKFLDARTASIKKKLDEINALKEEAHKLLYDIRKLHQNLMAEVTAINNATNLEIERMKRNAEKELTAKFHLKTSHIGHHIKVDEAKTLFKCRLKIVQLAVEASMVILQQQGLNKIEKNLVEESLGAIAARMS